MRLSLIGHLVKAAIYASIEALSIDFVRFTLMPYMVMVEKELNRKLFRETEFGSFTIKLDVNALLRGDIASLPSYYRERAGKVACLIKGFRVMEN